MTVETDECKGCDCANPPPTPRPADGVFAVSLSCPYHGDAEEPTDGPIPKTCPCGGPVEVLPYEHAMGARCTTCGRWWVRAEKEAIAVPTELDLGPIEARLKVISSWPWVHERADWQSLVCKATPPRGPGRRLASVGGSAALGHNGWNDAEFIVNAPADVTALLAEVRLLRAALKETT